MSPKYRFLLAVLLTLLAICSQVVFGQTKSIQRIVHLSSKSLEVGVDNLKPNDCSTGPGQIAITPKGGIGPYKFSWTGPSGYTSSTEDISGLAAGDYTFTVTDGSGCSVSRTVMVEATCVSGCNLFNAVGITSATACNASNGAITVNMSGGSGSYSYQWYNKNFTPIATTKNLTNALPGTYYLEVKDNVNTTCTVFYYFYVQSPFRVTALPTSNNRCAPPFTGAIATTVVGGSGNYTYQWVHPDGSITSGGPALSSTRGGNYTVVVRDNVSGCETEQAVFVNTTPIAPITLSETIGASTACTPANGAANITVGNGSGNYSYAWYNQSNGSLVSTVEDLTGVAGAPYSIYVTDNLSGCSAFKAITIPDQTKIPAYTFSTTNNTACSAPFTGSINLTFSEAGNYSVQWKNLTSTISTAEDLVSLGPGSYGLTVTNATTGCTTTRDATGAQAIKIEDESAERLQVSIDITNGRTSCNAPNGSIQATVESALPYTLSWVGPNGFTSTAEDITGLDSGVYLLTATTQCNLAPVIKNPVLSAARSSVLEVDLLDIITDVNDNLDLASVSITQQPVSGADVSLSEDLVLSIQYNSSFKGLDQMRLRACDLMNACTENTLTIQVEVNTEVVVYNAVAPNSPGDNKFMRIEHLPEQNRVTIFNRWGDKVFEVDGYQNEIPGKRFEGISTVGKSLPTGTYFYKIEADQIGNALTGYLSLKQ